MTTKLRVRTPSPKTVTFDTLPSPVPLKIQRGRRRFYNHIEWERYLSKYSSNTPSLQN